LAREVFSTGSMKASQRESKSYFGLALNS